MSDDPMTDRSIEPEKAWPFGQGILYAFLGLAVILVNADVRDEITAVSVFLGTAAGFFLLVGAFLWLRSGYVRFGDLRAMVGLPALLVNALYAPFAPRGLILTIGAAAFVTAIVEFRKNGERR